MATDRFGPTKVKRGLSNILSLASTNEVWDKRSIKKEVISLPLCAFLFPHNHLFIAMDKRWYWFTNADKMIICKKDFAQCE